MKSKVYKLDVGKLVPAPVDLTKLSDVVKRDVIGKTEYDEFVKKFNTIQTANTSNLVKKVDYNTKINENEKKNTDHDHSNKYITTQEFNKVTAENCFSRLGQAKIILLL